MDDTLSSFHLVEILSESSLCPVPFKTPYFICLWCTACSSTESQERMAL